MRHRLAIVLICLAALAGGAAASAGSTVVASAASTAAPTAAPTVVDPSGATGGVSPAAPVTPYAPLTPSTAPTFLTATPYMGWNTYYGVGGVYDQQTIISVAQSLLQRGLASAGYRIVWLDFGWATGARSRNGELIVSRRQWPNGLAWLTNWLHAHGLLAGIYTDAGRSGCRNKGVGSYGHYQEDVNQFAAWGFDAVKVDFCGAGQEGLNPRPLYRQVARAIRDNTAHRPLLFNVCNFWAPRQINGVRPTLANSSYTNAQWAPKIAQSWRTDTDIGSTGHILFQNVRRNLAHDATDPAAAGPGHWNDPDYLGPQLGMTTAEAQAQLTMWSIVAAPLIIGSDPRKLSPASIAMLENPRVLAVDQDRLGIQGRELAHAGDGQVWAKPLTGSARAVALLNTGPTAITIATTARATGLHHATHYAVRNLWSGRSSTSAGPITAVVAPDSALLYRVTITR